jgi:hypothetical protein
LYKGLTGASADRSSINYVYEMIDNSPHANTVREHLTEQFNLDSIESVGVTLLQKDGIKKLPDRPVEVCIGLHFDTYYGDKDEMEALYFSQAKRGTTAFHASPTLYMCGCVVSGTRWRFVSWSPATLPTVPRRVSGIFETKGSGESLDSVACDRQN